MNIRKTFNAAQRMDTPYELAIKLLNGRRRQARPNKNATNGPDMAPSSKSMPIIHGAPTLKGKPSLVGMREWLHMLGHSDAQLESLNIIHISGTKGKGSTCAFIDSFLRTHKARTGSPHKHGLYTSPHLVHTEERIRINSVPISRDKFAKYVFEVWDCLSQQSDRDGNHGMPRYLQLLLLVSFHTFIKEGVDVAVYETHHGGEYDATNVISKPIATGVTTIGLDHIDQLGPTIENIAWHKSGIFKPGVPAFSTPQESQVIPILKNRAEERNATLQFVDCDPCLPTELPVLQPHVQRKNCSLALALVQSFLTRRAPLQTNILSKDDIRRGVEQFYWPGRFQKIIHGRQQWFLDGAHNQLSGTVAGHWFADVVTDMQGDTALLPRVLIFSQISGNRDGSKVLKCLIMALQERNMHIDHVVFTTYDENRDGSTRIDKQLPTPADSAFNLEAQKNFEKVWRTFDESARIVHQPTIEDALATAKTISDESNGAKILVTGSLYLVGSVLSILQPGATDSLSHKDDIRDY